MKLTNAIVVRILTTLVSLGLYKCNSCDKLIRSTNGFTNVMNHIRRFHPDFESLVRAALRDPNVLALRLVDPRVQDLFRWIEWIVQDFLPLSFCERELVRKNAKLSRVCTKTLKSYMAGLVKHVVQRISEQLPDTFGIVLDGWTSNGRHFYAIFAVFDDADAPPPRAADYARTGDYHDDLECHSRRFVLLAFCPVENEEDLSAQSLFDLIADTLSRFNKPWSSVLFMVGDNCSVNQCIGNRTGALPFIGCASHRFALAVKDFLQADDDLIEKVHALMKKLSTIKGRAVLAKVSDKEPVPKNDTRWSSVYAMMQRYSELEGPLATLDHRTVSAHELQPLLPNRSEGIRISSLLEHLERFQSVTAELQRSTITMSAVRRLFDLTIEEYPQLRSRLSPSAAIINYPALESGLVKIQRQDPLNAPERAACASFRRDGEEDEGKTEEDDISFASRAFKRRRTVRRQRYVDVGYIPPTSNECERFFSRAKLVYSDLRKSMDKGTLQTLMFLHCNREHWDVYAVEAVKIQLGRNAEV